MGRDAFWVNTELESAGLPNMCGPIAVANFMEFKGYRRSLRVLSRHLKFSPEHGTGTEHVCRYFKTSPVTEKSEMRSFIVSEPCIFAYMIPGHARRDDDECHIVITLPLEDGTRIIVINDYGDIPAYVYETETFFESVGLQGFCTRFKGGLVIPESRTIV